MTTRIRTTISITPEAHEVFKRMALAGNMSVSMAMGEWLADTSDAAQMIVLQMEEAKKAPVRVLYEMRGLIAGLSNSVDEAMVEVRGKRSPAGVSRRAAASRAPIPPSSNTGGKVPLRGKKQP